MPIAVRYGPQGPALQAAVQAGEGEDFWRRAQAEQQLVSGIRNYYQQQDANELQARRLQLAAQQARRQRATPTSGTRARRGRTPVTDSVSQAFRDVGISPEDQARLNIANQYGGVQASRPILEEVMGPFGQRPRADPMQTAKQAYFQSIQEDLELDPSQEAALTQLIASPDIDLGEFRRALSETRQLSQGKQREERYERSMRDRQLANQEREVQDEIEDLRERLVDQGVDPSISPSKLSGKPRETPTTGSEWIDNVLEAYAYYGEPERGQPQAVRSLARLKSLQNQLNKVRQQRAELTQVPSQQGGQSETAETEDITQKSTAELFRELMGG